MAVGIQGNTGTLDAAITNNAIGMRNLMQSIVNMSTWINGQGNGLTALEDLGYSNTANPNNPGGISDAQMALNMISYLNTVAEVYFGTATQATTFNFNNELSQLWAGQ